MSRAQQSSILILLVLISAVNAQAVGKLTEDPNTPGARARKKSDDLDTRVAQKVTYEARQKSVLGILNDLSGLTGVKLKAGYNDEDWQVRDRRMSIFAQGFPLSNLMNSIACVMSFKWTRAGEEGAWSYRLTMDRKALLDGELRREREEQRRTEKRRKFIDDCTSDTELSEDDLAKLKEEDPSRYLMKKSGVADALGAFLNEVPAAADALATGNEFVVTMSQLTPSAQQAVMRFARSVEKLGGTGSTQRSESLAGKADKVTVRVNRSSTRMRPWFVLGTVQVGTDQPDEGIGLPIIDPDSRTERIAAKTQIKCMEENRPTSEAEEKLIEEAAQSDADADETVEPAAAHPDDPVLHRKIKVDIKNGSLTDIQSAIAEAGGFAVVSDSFPSSDGRLILGPGETELKTILTLIADNYYYNWNRHGTILQFQDRNWVKKRAAQIPDAWLEKWRRTLKDKGFLDVADLAQIAMLEPEQVEENIAPDSILGKGTLVSTISANREPLRLYASLNAAERNALLSGTGLDLGQLDPSRRARAAALISRNLAAAPDDGESCIAKLIRTTTAGIPQTYSFEITDPDGSVISRWHIPVPTRERPKPATVRQP